MPTVMLTTVCPNSCPWCFAREKMAAYAAQGVREMGCSDFQAMVNFYRSSGLTEMILLGGEPLLHTRIVDCISLLAGEGFRILVVTCGRAPSAVVKELACMQVPGLRYMLNSTPYFKYTPQVRQAVDNFMQNAGYPVMLSYAITAGDALQPTLFPVIDRIGLMMKFNLAAHLQFQIAVPSAGNSGYVPFDRYGTVIDLLGQWCRVLAKNRISFGLDCHCVPKCAGAADREDALTFHSRCTRFMLDIGPGLDVWPCFPLSETTVKLHDFDSIASLEEFFTVQAATGERVGEPQCRQCREWEHGACDAGCRGFHQVRRRAAGGSR